MNDMVPLLAGLISGGAGGAIIQSTRTLAAESANQVRTDAGRLIALLTKHGKNFGGTTGSSASVDGYEAAARLAGHPMATVKQAWAAEQILSGDQVKIRASENVLRDALQYFRKPGIWGWVSAKQDRYRRKATLDALERGWKPIEPGPAPSVADRRVDWARAQDDPSSFRAKSRRRSDRQEP